MNVPKLRFKQFKSPWKEIILGNLLTFNNGINTDKDSYGHGRKFINVLDILNNNFIKYDDIIGSVSVSKKVEETNKVEYGDLVFLRSSETREDIGKSSVYLDMNNYALFGGFVIRGKKQDEYHPYFLKLNLELPKVRNQIGAKAGGSTRFNVSQSVLSSIEIQMPDIKEQQKIAGFIGILDKKIEKQIEKISLLNRQKHGFMQKIFSKEIRFKDKNNIPYPKWRNLLLGEIVDTFSGGTPLVSVKSYYQGTIPFIRSGEIHLNETEVFINEEALLNSTAKIVKKGDLLYALYGATSGEVSISKIDGAINQAILCIRTSEVKEFIMYFLQYNKQRITSTFLQGGQGNLSAQIVKSIPIRLPIYEEQLQIAKFLMNIDLKIQREIEKLEEIKIQKQGFLHQLFL